jgi:hypothetical protein
MFAPRASVSATIRFRSVIYPIGGADDRFRPLSCTNRRRRLGSRRVASTVARRATPMPRMRLSSTTAPTNAIASSDRQGLAIAGLAGLHHCRFVARAALPAGLPLSARSSSDNRSKDARTVRKGGLRHQGGDRPARRQTRASQCRRPCGRLAGSASGPALTRLRESPRCLPPAPSAATCKHTSLSLGWRSGHLGPRRSLLVRTDGRSVCGARRRPCSRTSKRKRGSCINGIEAQAVMRRRRRRRGPPPRHRTDR